MADPYLIPADTLPLVAEWVTTQLGIESPIFLHLSEHQQQATLRMEIDEGDDYLGVLQKACGSLSAEYRFNERGKLQIINMIDDREADHLITYDDIKTIEISAELPELSSFLLRYAYEENEYTNSIRADNRGHHYPANWEEKKEVDTVLVDRNDAMRQVQLIAPLRFIRRRLYSVICFTRGVLFKKGDRVKLFHPLWGLDDTGTIISEVERLIGRNEITILVQI